MRSIRLYTHITRHSNDSDTDDGSTIIPVTAITPTPTSNTPPSAPTTSTSTIFVIESTTTSLPNTTVTVFSSPTLAAVGGSSAIILSNGAIVGIAVGGSAFLILVFVLAVLLWRYRRRREAQKTQYTPWSRLNSNSGGSSSSDGQTIRSRPSNAVSVLEVPIPTSYLFDSPVSLRPRFHPFRASQSVDGRTLLKSLVPHDYPVPQLPTQPHHSTAYDNMVPPRRTQPQQFPTRSSDSSPSLYESDPGQDLHALSHKAVDQHTPFVIAGPSSRLSPIPISLQPRTSFGLQSAQAKAPVLKSPPPAVTRSRSREARAIAELIKAIDSPPSSDDPHRRTSVLSSKHTSMRSETNDSVGIAVTTPFAPGPSLYGSDNASSQWSMTNTILHQITSDFPRPPEFTGPLSNFLDLKR